jgi:hypothetical protein
VRDWLSPGLKAQQARKRPFAFGRGAPVKRSKFTLDCGPRTDGGLRLLGVVLLPDSCCRCRVSFPDKVRGRVNLEMPLGDLLDLALSRGSARPRPVERWEPHLLKRGKRR